MLPALITAVPLDTDLATPRTVMTPGLWLAIWFSSWSWMAVFFPVFLIPLHFPTGRPPTPRWRWVNWLALGMWLFFIIIAAFLETIGPLNYDWTLPNPVGFIKSDTADSFFSYVWGVGLITLVSAGVLSLFLRYRRGVVVERQQIKWLLYVGAIFVIIYSASVVVSGNEESSPLLLDLFFIPSILAFPVVIAIAILRYQLFDIDVIIRKTAVYTVLTAVLALVYFGTIILLQSLVGRATGEQSPLIIVFSTLLIAALFAPLRRRIQAVIDRRLFRKKYDAQQVLAQFAQTARDESDMAALQAELLRVVQETMQPEKVSLWLPKRENS
jgi:hypothetical protein